MHSPEKRPLRRRFSRKTKTKISGPVQVPDLPDGLPGLGILGAANDEPDSALEAQRLRLVCTTPGNPQVKYGLFSRPLSHTSSLKATVPLHSGLGDYALTCSNTDSPQHPLHVISRDIHTSTSQHRPGTQAQSVDQPPWDRITELVWNKNVVDGETRKKDEGVSFENVLARLKEMAAADEARDPPTEEVTPSETDAAALAVPMSDGKSRRNTHSRILMAKTARNAADKRYFGLPAHIRFLIMKHLLHAHNPDDKPIRMNNPVHLWEAWPVNKIKNPTKLWIADYFDSLESVLHSLSNYTSTCSAMRADVLAALFLTRRFHIVYSPYVSEKIHFNAIKYMDRYGPLMASITVEVDFTKLAGSFKPGAADLDAAQSMKGVLLHLKRFVDGQKARPDGVPLRDFRVLVRRYYGYRPYRPTSPRPKSKSPASSRPSTPESTSTSISFTFAKPTSYTPDSLVADVLAPLSALGSCVQSLTITGAPQDVATGLVLALQKDVKKPEQTDTIHNADDDEGQSPEPDTTNLDTTQSDNNRCLKNVVYRLPAREYPSMPGHRAIVTCATIAGKCVCDDSKTKSHNGLGTQVVVVEGVEREKRQHGNRWRVIGGASSLHSAPWQGQYDDEGDEGEDKMPKRSLSNRFGLLPLRLSRRRAGGRDGRDHRRVVSVPKLEVVGDWEPEAIEAPNEWDESVGEKIDVKKRGGPQDVVAEKDEGQREATADNQEVVGGRKVVVEERHRGRELARSIKRKLAGGGRQGLFGHYQV